MKYKIDSETKKVLCATEDSGPNIFEDSDNEINENDIDLLNLNGHVIGSKYKVDSGDVLALPAQKYVYIVDDNDFVIGFKGMSLWAVSPAVNELWLNTMEWTNQHLFSPAGFQKYIRLTSTTWELA